MRGCYQGAECVCGLLDWREGWEGRKQLWVIPIPGVDKEEVISRYRHASSYLHRQRSGCRGPGRMTQDFPSPVPSGASYTSPRPAWILDIGTQLCNVGGRKREKTCLVQTFLLHRPRFYQMPPRQKGCGSDRADTPGE